MNWLNKIGKKNKNENLWHKCPECHHVVSLEEFEQNAYVCEKCHYHQRITAHERIQLLLDANSFIETNADLLSVDMLNFFDGTTYYTNKLKESRQKNELKDAIITGKGKINNVPVYTAVMDFGFMGGSMGSVVGEKITRTIEDATKDQTPLIIVCASGGARMQEGILSLMQMAKTAAALERFSEAGGLYIPVLTNPTTGGVTASFAMLGDFILAESKALIGFAGPRVISQTIKQKLPEGFQRAEFLQEHGFVDIVADRTDLKQIINQLITFAN